MNEFFAPLVDLPNRLIPKETCELRDLILPRLVLTFTSDACERHGLSRAIIVGAMIEPKRRWTHRRVVMAVNHGGEAHFLRNMGDDAR